MEVYEELLVPRLLAPLAELLLDDLGVKQGERLLDVACGPGTVALAAARRGAAATGCDISPVMLASARQKSTAIEWVETPAAPLAGIPDAAFDVVTCQQGLQFFPDRPAAVAEMHRALRPGGRVGVALWAPIERSPVFAALRAVVHDLLGHDAASRYESGPWALTDPTEATALLHGAGFAEVEAHERVIDVTFEGGRDQAASTLSTTPVADEVADIDRYALEAATELHLSPLTGDDGAIRAPVPAWIVIGARR